MDKCPPENLRHWAAGTLRVYHSRSGSLSITRYIFRWTFIPRKVENNTHQEAGLAVHSTAFPQPIGGQEVVALLQVRLVCPRALVSYALFKGCRKVKLPLFCFYKKFALTLNPIQIKSTLNKLNHNQEHKSNSTFFIKHISWNSKWFA